MSVCYPHVLRTHSHSGTGSTERGGGEGEGEGKRLRLGKSKQTHTKGSDSPTAVDENGAAAQLLACESMRESVSVSGSEAISTPASALTLISPANYSSGGRRGRERGVCVLHRARVGERVKVTQRKTTIFFIFLPLKYVENVSLHTY